MKIEREKTLSATTRVTPDSNKGARAVGSDKVSVNKDTNKSDIPNNSDKK